MRSVLYVGTRRTSLEVNAAVFGALDAGYRVALLAPRHPEFGGSALSDVQITDLHDRERALTDAIELARRTPVSGVVSCSDSTIELAAAIAQKLGLAGPSPEAAHRARNKQAMRACLADRPDLIPRFAPVNSLESLRAAHARIGTPAVLKPAGANGSKAVMTVRHDTDLAELFAVATHVTSPGVDPIFGDYPGEFVYEEMLGGSEHSVEGFVHGGRVSIAGITDKWVKDEYFTEYQEIHPTRLAAPVRDRVYALTRDVIARVGIDNCSFHLECRVLSDGTARLLEVAARPGGGYIASHLVPMSTGIPFHTNIVRVATGDTPIMESTLRLVAGSRSLLSPHAGRFQGFAGLADVHRLWGVEHVVLEREPGSDIVMPPAEAASSWLGSVIVRAGDYDEVLSTLAEVDRLAQPIVTPLP